MAKRPITADDITKGDEATLRGLKAFADDMTEPFSPAVYKAAVKAEPSMITTLLDELSSMGGRVGGLYGKTEPSSILDKAKDAVRKAVSDEFGGKLSRIDAPAADAIVSICKAVELVLRQLSASIPTVMVPSTGPHGEKGSTPCDIAPFLLTAAAQLDVIGSSLGHHWAAPIAEPEKPPKFFKTAKSEPAPMAAFLDAIEEIE